MLSLKCLLPGYRARWYRRASFFLGDLARVAEAFEFGWDGETPTARSRDGLLFAGFPTPPGDAEIYALLRPKVPKTIGEGHFRLARDLVTRYLYPHLRPDMAPDKGRRPSGDAAMMSGYHGQQKDTALHIADPERRARFVEAFRPKCDDTIVNCGAFIGLGDAAVAPLLTKGRVVALEADARCYDLLTRNLSTNGIANVTPCHAAIWNADHETLDLATGEAQANSLLQEVHDAGGRALVSTVTVDGLAQRFGLERVTMLSLTVNGAEIEALKGAATVLKSHRPRIRLAGWYQRDGRAIAEHCSDRLKSAGYDVHIGPGLGVLALPAEAGE
ncbi:MAG: FkbM family methyltransferase [Marivibrio sp.]|uniref:FkbM family methyltransferase n=1 Tax=Marivibrio sp. TaxID=2039719 RepID=UPI0032EEA6E4